jgi:peptide/nickel transport system substrate-binding protein
LKRLSAFAAIAALAMLVSFGLSACGSSSGEAERTTLRTSYNSFPDFLDPALSVSLEGTTAMWTTYIPLLTYAHADGNPGTELIPGLAKSLPKLSDGGRTYTLFLRPGLRYSDGTPVRASDFTHTVERAFEIGSPGSPFFLGIVGAERFAETKRGGIAGIETDDRSGKIVIHLTEPRGTFANELAMLFVAPVPPGTPSEDQTSSPPPAVGPYVIVETRPGRGWRYERNPQWAHNAELLPQIPGGHVEAIDVTVVSNQSSQVADVEAGRYDWMQNPPPADLYADVKRKYEGTQFRTAPQINLYYFWMNAREAPFDDVRVRRAVNYAIDPRALERIYAGQMKATQQILPPGMPGYEPYAPYPHDLAKAKALIAAADPADRDISVWGVNLEPNREATEYYEGVLRELGFETTLKLVGPENYFTIIGNTSTSNLDTGWTNWYEDYPHPSDYFAPQLTAASLQPTGNPNWSQFDDPKLSAEVERLGREQLGPEQEAAYAKLDRAYMRQAPWAPFGSFTLSTFVSSDIDLDEVVISPIYGQDLTSFQFK